MPIVYKFWEPQPPGALRTCTEIALPFMAQAVSRLSLTVRSGLDSRPVHVRFTVNEVALVQFSANTTVSIIPSALHIKFHTIIIHAIPTQQLRTSCR